MTNFKNRKGFTLVELIVVIAVLALLAVGAVLAIAGIQRNARMTTNRNAANELVTALNRQNAMGGVIVSAVPSVAATSWTSPPSIPGGDSLTVSIGFSSADRMTQVGSWLTFDTSTNIWSVRADANFDVPAA